MPSFSLSKKVFAGAVLTLVGIIAIAVFASLHMRRLIHTEDQITESLIMLEKDEEVLRHLLEAEGAAHVYLLDPSPEQYATYERASSEASAMLEKISPLLTSNPQRFAAVERAVKQHLQFLEEVVALRKNGFAKEALDRFQEGKSFMLEMRTALERMSRDEQKALDERRALSASLRRNSILGIGTALMSMLIIAAVTAILRDIASALRTDRRIAEERNLLRHIIDSIPLQIFVKDTEGHFVIDNAAHRHFLGIEDPEGIAGKIVEDFLPPESANSFNESDAKVLASADHFSNKEEIVAPLHGKVAWLSTTKIALKDTQNRVIGIVGSSIDISERKAGEERLRLFASQLEASNEELREFASVASHDLQEPLRKIRAFADRLGAKYGEVLEEQGRDYLQRMQSAGQRMQALIEDLLILSRLSSHAGRFEKVSLKETVANVLADLELRIEQTNAHIEVGNLPVIEADPVQMHQLFQNLISNALKFHKQGVPPEITISGKVLQMQDNLICGATPGDQICQIMVKDNGIGIEEKYAEQIFVLFQRLHDLDFYQGTGIGLSVCRKITHRHGGTITVKSAKNEGATFIIMLPLKQMN